MRLMIERVDLKRLKRADRLNVVFTNATRVQMFSSHEFFHEFSCLRKGQIINLESDYVYSVAGYTFHKNPKLIN